jgi:hypothetical protein
MMQARFWASTIKPIDQGLQKYGASIFIFIWVVICRGVIVNMRSNNNKGPKSKCILTKKKLHSLSLQVMDFDYID